MPVLLWKFSLFNRVSLFQELRSGCVAYLLLPGQEFEFGLRDRNSSQWEEQPHLFCVTEKVYGGQHSWGPTETSCQVAEAAGSHTVVPVVWFWLLSCNLVAHLASACLSVLSSRFSELPRTWLYPHIKFLSHLTQAEKLSAGCLLDLQQVFLYSLHSEIIFCHPVFWSFLFTHRECFTHHECSQNP